MTEPIPWLYKLNLVSTLDDGQREQAVLNVRDGILRFLDRPENSELKESFTANPSWTVYQQAIDDELWDAMGAGTWLCLAGKLNLYIAEELWEDAVYQVCTLLCQPDESAS